MGGGISSLSKICIVGNPSTKAQAAGADVEYTFVQVGIRDTTIDYSGNCGNLSSMIGPFALFEGIADPSKPIMFKDGKATVKAYNTNTDKVINTTFPAVKQADSEVPLLPVLDLPETTIAGVHGQASKIVLDFVSPGGAGTGKLLPTGKASEELVDGIVVSLVDATNPTVFVKYEDIRGSLKLSPETKINFADSVTLELLENIRTLGGERMGLAFAQAQPKIAILRSPGEENTDIFVHTLSMGVMHKAVPMTVGLCLGVAAGIENTLAWEIVQKARKGKADLPSHIRVKHPSGTVDVGADFGEDGVVKSAQVVRTGRRLMKGVVWW